LHMGLTNCGREMEPCARILLSLSFHVESRED